VFGEPAFGLKKAKEEEEKAQPDRKLESKPLEKKEEEGQVDK
jgi:hypothetical protein